jgi:hypothetical protein
MNKKADGEILFFIILFRLLLLIGSWFKSTNPYNTYMDDCKKINRDKFPCSGIVKIFENCTYEETNLTNFCQNKWDKINESKLEQAGVK